MTGVGLWVVGRPAPQGSKRHVGNGVMVESSKYVGTWRQAVTAAALDVRPAEPLDGPLHVVMAFTLARPRSAPKRREWPDTMPDLSKLVRATEDAITDAGIWADDARVVSCAASKVWWPHQLALPVPGCVVAVDVIPGSWACFDAALADARRALEATP